MQEQNNESRGQECAQEVEESDAARPPSLRAAPPSALCCILSPAALLQMAHTQSRRGEEGGVSRGYTITFGSLVKHCVVNVEWLEFSRSFFTNRLFLKHGSSIVLLATNLTMEETCLVVDIYSLAQMVLKHWL